MIPDGLTECPRCGVAAQYLKPDHLNRCGSGWREGNWSAPREFFLAGEYLGRATEEQARMHRLEIDVVRREEQEHLKTCQACSAATQVREQRSRRAPS